MSDTWMERVQTAVDQWDRLHMDEPHPDAFCEAMEALRDLTPFEPRSRRTTKSWSEIKHKSTPEQREAARAELDAVLPLLEALHELDEVHARLIAAVTPKHPGWIGAPSEEYDALFSAWHAATRKCRSFLGPNLHAEPNARDDRDAA